MVKQNLVEAAMIAKEIFDTFDAEFGKIEVSPEDKYLNFDYSNLFLIKEAFRNVLIVYSRFLRELFRKFLLDEQEWDSNFNISLLKLLKGRDPLCQ